MAMPAKRGRPSMGAAKKTKTKTRTSIRKAPTRRATAAKRNTRGRKAA